MNWEVDWTHEGNTGQEVMARNTTSWQMRTQQWHMVSTGYLRSVGISTPTYRRDSWEVDWSRRDEKMVYARNQSSKMPGAREWHWVDFHTLNRSGVKWMPKKEKTGRYTNAQGYIVLTRRAMTEEDITLAEAHGLFRGAKKSWVREHRLIALKKYGILNDRHVVRHLNGVKTDNRPENLVRGTTQENTMDHNEARLAAMYWREKYEELLASVETSDQMKAS